IGIGVAAALSAVVGMRIFGFPMRAAAPQFREVVAPSGGTIALRLPDGTHVVLGPESRLRYATVVNAHVRHVHLTGTALFDVGQDASRPFIVHAIGGEAQAVGTSFNVRAYPGDTVLFVVVAEGRVVLRPDGSPASGGTLLEAGQRGALHHDRVLVESGVDL